MFCACLKLHGAECQWLSPRQGPSHSVSSSPGWTQLPVMWRQGRRAQRDEAVTTPRHVYLIQLHMSQTVLLIKQEKMGKTDKK